MKKILLLTALIASLYVTAQTKEGFVKYLMTLESSEMKSNPMMGNSEITIYFKGNKSLTEMKTPIFTTKTLLSEKGALILMDGVGQKFYTRKTKAELDKAKSEKKPTKPTIIYTTEKKKILGYDCTKVIVSLGSVGGKMMQMTAWVTEKIQTPSGLGPVDAEMLSSLKGMALELNMGEGAIKSKMVATEVSMKPVADAVFNVSTAGYTERKITPRAGMLPK